MDRVILIGLSGTGKSTVARRLAERLNYDSVDLDDEIVSSFGCPIPAIFERYGEPVFRASERSCLIQACRRRDLVVATGGGVVVDARNWVTMRPDSLILHLTATHDEIFARLSSQAGQDPDSERPLLASADPGAALAKLSAERAPLYHQADRTIDTTGKTIESVADEIVQIVGETESGKIPVPIASIGAPYGRSDLYVQPDLIEFAGQLAIQRFPDSRRAWVITDTNVGPIWADPVHRSLEDAGFTVERLDVPAGEAAKSFAHVSALLDALLEARLDRRDIVIALGGGVVGDLAGFVAAIALRGVGLIQIPTSLLAMVDSSVGGKTGVNHAQGKNLIGAFYQPQLVLADPAVLGTLPEREWRGGWAEIVKHAMIERTATGGENADLLDLIERSSDADMRDPAFMADVVRRNVLIKASVVVQDERESGLRRVLNYGHTLGHAMEAADYRYHHGEAVALGMRAAAHIARTLGRTTEAVQNRQNALLDRIGLPSAFDGDLARVIDRLGSDKKAVHGTLTWILPGETAGSVEITRDVPMASVEDAAVALGARR